MQRMLRLFPFIALFALLVPVFARAEAWVGLSTPTGLGLYGIDCVTASACITVGDTGTILYTTDRYTWQEGTSGVATVLNDVDYYSSTLAIAVGNGGVILKSTDGGITWSSLTSSTTEDLYDVAMASATVGWAVGEDTKIMKTTDGGTTWTNVATTGIDARSVDAVSTSVVWVAGKSGTVLRSTNGGTTWSDLSAAVASTNVISTIDAISSTTAYIGGQNALFMRTADSGVTWTSLTATAFDAGESISDISMYTTSYGVAVGNSGHVVRISANTTVTEELVLDSPTGFYDVATPAAAVSYIVGLGVVAAYDIGGPEAPEQFEMESGDGQYTNSLLPTFTWDAAFDEISDILGYEFSLDASTWAKIGDVTTYTLEDNLTAGEQTVYVRAYDVAFNTGDSSALTITVDQTDPTVGSVTPTTATAGTSTQFRAEATDASGIASCALYVDGSSVGAMSYDSAADEYYRSRTFSSAGTYAVYAYCTDSAGNTNAGTTASITVAASTTTTDTTDTSDDGDEATAGDLIKTACPGGEDVNDPCRAVYFLGSDGKRHAFPNEKVFFTWYADFDDVVVVSSSYMASVTLGRNVTYHPGTTMVKFPSLNTVYGVGEEGELRAITSQDVAISIFGSNWNTMIHDISEAFYGNYEFGDDIDSTSDFDPDEVEDSVDSINDIL